MSLPQARRLALAAQGLSRARTETPVTARRIASTVRSIAQLQIDSINVVRRAHYMPIFARLGPYDTSTLDQMVAQKNGMITEFWAHEASYVHSDLVEDLLLWQRRSWVDRSEQFTDELHALSNDVLAYLGEHPGTTARQLSAALDVGPVEAKEHWGWNWNQTKYVTEALFAQAKILALGRSTQFERRFALAEHVLPGLQEQDTTRKNQALDRLVLRSLGAQGVGTAHCVAEYFRLPVREVSAKLGELVTAGRVHQVQVDGIPEPCFRDPQLAVPRKIDEDLRLMSPFDSMIFNRRRLERFFNFTYRVEIYVPQDKRQYGYYVFPILLGDRFIGRVDLKADRKTGALRANSVHYEPDAPVGIGGALRDELERLARWLGLSTVEL